MRRWDGIDEFIAVCDAGGFSRAAERLGLSTSHVSREVARLEERLQTRLFHRTTRRVALTDDGHHFADRMRPILAQRDEAFATLSRAEDEYHGHIRLTCSTAFGEHFVAPLIGRFIALHAGISIHMDLTNQLVDVVAQGFDLAIRTGQVGDPRLTGRRIGTRRFLLCAAPAYLARRGAPEVLDDLARHDCLIGSTESWHFNDAGAEHLIRPRGRFRCNSGFAVVGAALDGLGICQLPEFYVAPHLATGQLVRLLEDREPPEQLVWAAFPTRVQLSVKLQLFLDYLGENLEP